MTSSKTPSCSLAALWVGARLTYPWKTSQRWDKLPKSVVAPFLGYSLVFRGSWCLFMHIVFDYEPLQLTNINHHHRLLPSWQTVHINHDSAWPTITTVSHCLNGRWPSVSIIIEQHWLAVLFDQHDTTIIHYDWPACSVIIIKAEYINYHWPALLIMFLET